MLLIVASVKRHGPMLHHGVAGWPSFLAAPALLLAISLLLGQGTCCFASSAKGTGHHIASKHRHAGRQATHASQSPLQARLLQVRTRNSTTGSCQVLAMHAFAQKTSLLPRIARYLHVRPGNLLSQVAMHMLHTDCARCWTGW